MKKIAFEAWEKNKDRILSYIEKYYSNGEYLNVGRTLFLVEIMNIAYGNHGTRIYNNLTDCGVSQVMLFTIFAEEHPTKPTVITTRYSVFNNYIIVAASMRELYDIAKDIVLSAKPIDETNCTKEWAEECEPKIICSRGLIT